MQLYLLHVGALLAAYTLWRKPIDVQTPLRSLTPLYKTRFLVLCYAIGHTTVSPSTRDLLNDDTHDIAFFLVWFVTTGLVHFVSAVLHTTIRVSCRTYIVDNKSVFQRYVSRDYMQLHNPTIRFCTLRTSFSSFARRFSSSRFSFASFCRAQLI